jgi:hypothetical protein
MRWVAVPLSLGAVALVLSGVLDDGRAPGRSDASGATRRLVSSSGAEVAVGPTGNVRTLRNVGGGGPIALADESGGLYVADPVTGERRRADGPITRGRRGLEQQSALADGGLAVQATYRLGPSGVLHVNGAVTNRRLGARAVDVMFSLPLRAVEGHWQPTTTDDVRITGDSLRPQVKFPLGAVVAPRHAWAVAYAISPSRPVRFAIDVTANGSAATFTVREKLGLSAAGTGPLHNRAPFGFDIDLGVDRRWGLRSALARYYRRAPAFFRDLRGVPLGWRVLPGRGDPAEGLLRLHEAGRGAAGAQRLAQFAARDGWANDRRAGTLTFPYTIAGQREVTDLPSLPTSAAEADAAFRAWTHDPVPFAGPNAPNAYPSAEYQKALIRSSAVYGADGLPKAVIRRTPWGGNSVTYPVNPAPALDRGPAGPRTVGGDLLRRYIPRLLSNPDVDGIYVDTLSGWGLYFNYRPEHVAAARIPLTYADTTSVYGEAHRPAVYNVFSEQELLLRLRRQLHATGKLLMGNGVLLRGGHETAFTGFALDVIGSERAFADLLSSEDEAVFAQEVAYRKPNVALLYDGWDDPSQVDALWKHALLHGMFPSSPGTSLQRFNVAGAAPAQARRSPAEIKALHTYGPILVRLARAGWFPVTGVSAPAMRVERYGARNDFYLVILAGPDGASGRLAVDHSVLDWRRRARVTDVLARRDWGTKRAAAFMARPALRLAPGQLSVLRIRARTHGRGH